jgi:hypothetical protein
MQKLPKKKLRLETIKIHTLSQTELATAHGGATTSDGDVCTAIYEWYWRVFLK